MQMCPLGAQIHSGGLICSEIFFLCFQEGVLCSPKGRECFEQHNKVGCGNSCEGIYADVEKFDEKMIESSDLDALIAKYREYKRHIFKNIGFNGSNYETSFGEF